MRLDLEVKNSLIHGLGVFTIGRIPKGTTVGIFEGKVTKVDGPYVLWVEQDDGSELGIDGKNALRYLNHSSSPNCEFDGAELQAVRAIPAGGELTFHYGDDWTEVR